MIIMNTSYLYAVIGLFALISLYVLVYDIRYVRWVKQHWFYSRRFHSYLATLLFLSGIMLMMVSALDIRGEEKKINAQIPEQKTVLMIDVSESMLAEDVRPNRFEKALIMAQIFVKRAVGHKIAVVIFSETANVVIPFTTDVDLINARLKALSKLEIVQGGTNLKLSIRETLGYIKTSGIDVGTNVLLFTDVEDQEIGRPVEVLDQINVGLVGIGTRDGSRIPIRDEFDVLKKYKTFKGNEVITKLGEGNIDKIFTGNLNYKYWIVNSSNLAVDEVYNFFQQSFKSKISDREIYIRDVYSYYFIFIGVVLYVFSMLLKFINPLKIMAAGLVFVLTTLPAFSVEEDVRNDLLNLLKSNKINKSEKNKLAEFFLKEGKTKEAVTLYTENRGGVFLTESNEVRFNRATALIADKNIKASAKEFLEFQNELKSSEELVDILKKSRVNLLLAVARQRAESQDKDKDKDKNKNKNKESKGNKENKKDGGDGQSEKPNNKSSQNKNNDKDEKKEDKKKDKQEKENTKDEQLEKEMDQARKMVKTPAVLKSLIDEDRNIQRKYMSTLIDRKSNKTEKRDW